MTRVVQPELLDHLPPGDASARGSRRDLRLINRLMGNAGALAAGIREVLSDLPQRPWTVVEAGAGDGTLAARVWSRLPPPPTGSRIQLLDQMDVVESTVLARLRGRQWQPEVRIERFEDGLAHSAGSRVDLLYANLFLHHFSNAALPELLARIAERSASVVFVEPRRSTVALLGARMLLLVGCNAVTRHDAVRSVHAGFRDSDLTEAWPTTGDWDLREFAAGPFAHCFVARRKTPR